MHILHVYKDYHPVLGGIEQHIGLLTPKLVARGVRVTVLVTARPGDPTTSTVEEGVEIVRVRRWGTAASTPLAPGLATALRRLRPDVTHIHAPYPPAELAHLLFGRGRPTVVYYHSDIVRQQWLKHLWLPLQRRLLHRTDRILTSSEVYVESSPVLAPLTNRVDVVPLGIDTDRFGTTDPAQTADIVARFAGPIVLFVGRLRYYKGLDRLIDAMSDIRASLLVVGRGPMEATWRRYAAASPAAERIHFLGDVPDEALAAHYAAAEVFVLPSTLRSEAFGLAQVEAMAASTPVISTQLGTGTSVVNQHGKTGLVVAAGDHLALAAALRQLLDDPATRERMGRAAQARVTSMFGINTMVDTLLAIYRELSSRA